VSLLLSEDGRGQNSSYVEELSCFVLQLEVHKTWNQTHGRQQSSVKQVRACGMAAQLSTLKFSGVTTVKECDLLRWFSFERGVFWVVLELGS